jgi:LEA14-like dessication related protein
MRRCYVLLLIFITATVFLLFLSCSALDTLVRDAVQKPRVSFRSAELVGLSFSDADLLFVLDIENPNPFGIGMAGFDYDLSIDDASFVSGDKNDRLDIDAGATSSVELPVNLNYADLFSSFSSLLDRDESKYRITMGFSFDLPVLGMIRIPVSREGEMPVLRFPDIRFGGFKLTNLSLTEAELTLQLYLDNPNALSLNLSSLSYDLEINGTPWIQGSLQHSVEVGEHQEGAVALPFTLNFIDMGLGVYDIVRNKTSVEYRVTGNYGFSTSLPLIGEVGSDFNMTGTTRILME